jgi:geranylgeranyl pyrophosphate synthase
MSSIENIENEDNIDIKESLTTFKEYQNKVNIELEKYIHSNFPTCIQPMINYMVDGGKRLRSVLVLLFGDIENHQDNQMMIDMAISIELIHCLSLVIDDTPSMDNDDFRRDKQSFHKKYGLPKTNLTIYYLINKITLLFSKYDFNNIGVANIISSNLNHLLEGQCLDVNLDKFEILKYDSQYYDEKKYLDSKTFIDEYQNIIDLLPKDFDTKILDAFIKNINLNFLKTSSLFCLSVLSPALLNSDTKTNTISKGCKEVKNKLKVWANLFGIAFQYSDDILDIEQDRISDNPNITFIIGKNQTVSFIKNILKYLKCSLPSILKRMDVYSSNKVQVIFEILNVILKRCSKFTELEI